MKSKDVHYVCSQCGRSETKWLGRCPDCGSWNTFEEEAIQSVSDGKHALISTLAKPVSLESVVIDPHFRYETGIGELDRVLGGGVMRGSSILLGGEPGNREIHAYAPSLGEVLSGKKGALRIRRGVSQPGQAQGPAIGSQALFDRYLL